MKKIIFASAIYICFSFIIDNSPKVDHEIWNLLLTKYVSSDGVVDYKEFKSSQPQLDAYLNLLSDNPPNTSWSKQEAMSFWINAYNANTVSLILKNYPISSIMDINNGKAWDLKFIKIGEKTYSLNNIEHDILRAKFSDPRIHFAVNCAAQSCPKLNNRAFTPQNLGINLNRLTKEFINNKTKNNLSSNPVEVSKLFEWYKDDFTKDGTVIDYINKYSTTKVKTSTKLEFMEYSWELNN